MSLRLGKRGDTREGVLQRAQVRESHRASRLTCSARPGAGGARPGPRPSPQGPPLTSHPAQRLEVDGHVVLRAAQAAVLAFQVIPVAGILGDPLDLKAAVGFRRELGNGALPRTQRKGEKDSFHSRGSNAVSLLLATLKGMLPGSDIVLVLVPPWPLTDCDDLSYNNSASSQLFRSLPESHANFSLGARPERGPPRPTMPLASSHNVRRAAVSSLLSVTGATQPVPDGPLPPGGGNHCIFRGQENCTECILLVVQHLGVHLCTWGDRP